MLGSKTYSTFDPRTLGGCTLWLDAADSNSVALSGANVTQWNDKSGNGYNAIQTNATYQPSFSSNGIVFNGNQILYTTLASAVNTQSWFIVMSWTSGSGKQTVVGAKVSGASVAYLSMLSISGTSATPLIERYGSPVVMTSSTTVAANTRFLQSATLSGGSTSFLYNNGTQVATNASSSALSGTGQVSIGAYDDTGASRPGGTPFIGIVYEIVLFSSLLTTSQRQAVEGYLTRKWGVGDPNTGTLSLGNPMSLSGLTLWLDAADSSTIDLSGTSVTQWRDKSGSNNHATGAGTARPTVTSNFVNNYSGIRGASNTYMSNTSMSLPLGTRTVFLVCSTYSTSTPTLGIAQLGTVPTGVAHGVDGLNTAPYQNQDSGQFGWIFRYFSGGGYYRQWTGTAGCNVTPFGVYGEVVSNQVLYPYVNGSNAGNVSFTAVPTTATGYYLGARYDTNAVQFGYPATFAEFLVYNTALSDTQRQSIENYLLNKWNIQKRGMTLPTSHPYRLAPPMTRPFTPLDVDGCALWFDAADSRTLTFTGSAVTTWADKSGNLRNATAATGASYSNSALVFTGTQTYTLSNAGSVFSGSPFGIFIVDQLAYSVGSPVIFGESTGNYTTNNTIHIAYLTGGSSLRFAYWNNSVDVSIGATAPRMWSLVLPSGANRYINQNGALGATAGNATQLSTQTGLRIGTYAGAGPNDLYRGNLYEIIGYRGALTSSDVQRIETYLANKWNLKGVTPSNHPARISPGLSVQFQPNLISGCALWLDAADSRTLTLSGTAITSWADKSGLGYNATAVGTISNTGRINGLQAATFGTSASTYFIGSSSNTGTALTAFAVFSMSSTAQNFARILGFQDSNVNLTDFNSVSYATAISRWSGSTTVTGARNGTQLSSITVSYDTPLIACTQFSGSNHTMFSNSTAGTSQSNSGSFAYSNYYIGTTKGAEDAVWFTGTIGEVIAYNASLTTAQRQQVEGYLAWKWGLQNNLPSNHPYRYSKLT